MNNLIKGLCGAISICMLVLLLTVQTSAQDCCSHLGQQVACPQNLPPGSRSVEFIPGGTKWVTPSGASVSVPQTAFPPCTVSTPATPPAAPGEKKTPVKPLLPVAKKPQTPSTPDKPAEKHPARPLIPEPMTRERDRPPVIAEPPQPETPGPYDDIRKSAERLRKAMDSQPDNVKETADKPPDEDCRCGPDITNALFDILAQVEADYKGLSWSDRVSQCSGMIEGTFHDAQAWDINQLFGEAPIIRGCPKCNNCFLSVTLLGRCYHGGVVNYTLWGAMKSLCGTVQGLIGSAVHWGWSGTALSPANLMYGKQPYEVQVAMAEAGAKYIEGASRAELGKFLEERIDDPGMTSCVPCAAPCAGRFNYNWWPKFKSKGFPGPAVRKREENHWLDPR
ncbi:MAG: hypothetical protein EPN25_04535 [Nitrospirae bacterium]|nr:MAG: hypothetical protein EPN25_04535 [Nitrospirota bacterium]